MLNSEEVLLASLIASPRIAASAITVLDASDFDQHEHKVIYATLVDMLDQGEVVDSKTLPMILADDGHEPDVIEVALRLAGFIDRSRPSIMAVN